MTTNDKDSKGVMTTTIDRYVSLAKKHGEATEQGNSDIANAAYKQLESLFVDILRNGSRELLVPLLLHDSPAVRTKAAFHTYVLDSKRSETVLKEVASGSGLIAFSAGITLKQLRNGALKPK